MGEMTGAKRSDTNLMVNNITFNDTRSSYTSSSISTDFYRNFILYIWLQATGTPTNIVYEVQFSHDNSTWYKYMNWFYGDLRYEDTANLSPGTYESVSFPCAGRYVRLKVSATGLSSSNYFVTKAYIEFYT